MWKNINIMNYLTEWKIFLYNKQIKQHDFDVTYRNNNFKNKLLHSTLYSFFTFSFEPFHIFTYISRCSYSYQTFTRITHKDVCKRRIENFWHRRIWISSNKIKLLRQFFMFNAVSVLAYDTSIAIKDEALKQKHNDRINVRQRTHK